MAMNDQRHIQNGGDPSDPELARLYREGAQEEPPAHVDAAVLAAARRSAHSGPLPGDKPQTTSRGWYVPLALAAVLVLSVSVVVLSPEVERLPQSVPETPPARTYEQRAPQEQRAAETPFAPGPSAPVSPAPQSAPSAQRSDRAASPKRSEAPPAVVQEERAVRQEDALQRSEAHPATARDTEAQKAAPRALSAPQAQSRPAAAAALSDSDAPDKWGERIMALRAEGKAMEADALLEQFRQRFPDYTVPEAWAR
jgi:hypothetical protein